jgi:rhodanese-related sulfurtransferase
MIDQVRPAALQAWLDAQAAAGVAPFVLDVRESWELEAASVNADSFELVAIPMMDVPERLAELDAGRPVAVLCHHGRRSQHVAMFLVQQGFARVANIAGGIDAWTDEVDPAVPQY